MKGKTSDDKDEEGDNAGPPGEAMVSMIICMIILTIFFIFFCLVPVYRWDTENWNIVTFDINSGYWREDGDTGT